MNMNRSERLLVLVLRWVGGVSLLAVGCAVMPYAWMNAVHGFLGMGTLPDAPIVGYLARSTSAFYAILGGLLWVVSFDVRRNRVVLMYLGVATLVFGVFLGAVDWLEGLPPFWRLWEGPFDVAFGLIVVGLRWRIDRDVSCRET